MEVLCCICGEAIDAPEDGTSHGLDPCAVLLITRWTAPEDQHEGEQYFCHYQCFRGVVEPHVQVTVGQE